MALDRTLVDDAFTRELHAVASRLRTSPEHLFQVMRFETGGTMDPAARNPQSGAIGLIQFTPSTARRLGTSTEALARMSPTEQLRYVEDYLRPYAGKVSTLDDLYAAIFAPKAIGKGADTVLYSKATDPRAYEQNRALDREGKGVITKADAVQAVMRTRGAGQGQTTMVAQATPAPTVAPRSAETEDGDDAGIDWSAALFQPTAAPRRPVATAEEARSRLREEGPAPETAAPTLTALAPLEVPEPLTPAQEVRTAQVAPGETDWSAVLFG